MYIYTYILYIYGGFLKWVYSPNHPFFLSMCPPVLSDYPFLQRSSAHHSAMRGCSRSVSLTSSPCTWDRGIRGKLSMTFLVGG